MSEESFTPFPVRKIIAGGQTGADSAGLDWAISHGLAHGGWCPRGRRCEDGVIDARYQLRETRSSGYLERTELNVVEADATVIFTLDERLSGGSLKTEQFALRHGKPVLHFRPGVHLRHLANFLEKHQVYCLNVAGSRASKAMGIQDLVARSLDMCVSPAGNG